MAIDRRTLIARSCMTAAALAARPSWAAAGIFRDCSRGSQGRRFGHRPRRRGHGRRQRRIEHGRSVRRSGLPRGPPPVGLTGSQLLPIDAKTGLHPSLPHLHDHLDAGRLAIVQGVGYPGPDMSHFRSDDIWEKAVPDPAGGVPGLARPSARSALP